MKTQFIHIKDISEIDTKKATVYDLNKRYIDPKGNMYGLRYNRQEKRIEIIRLMRTAAKHTNYFTQKMIQNQQSDKYKDQDISDVSVVGSDIQIDDFPLAEEELKEFIQNDDSEVEEPFNPDVFINDALTELNTHKERINGIIMNISNAKLYNWDDREASGRLDDFIRNIEIDGLQRIEKFLNYYRELNEYPRSISFYIGKLDTRSRNIIEKLSTDSAKMRFIYLRETCTNITYVVKSLESKLTDLLTFLLGLSSDHTSMLNQAEKQFLTDAKTSLENTLSEISNLFKELAVFENYIYTAKNL